MKRFAALLLVLFATTVSVGWNRHGSGSVTPPGSTTGLVANRTQVPNSVTTIAQNRTSRIQHFAPTDGSITSLKTVDVGYYLTSSGPVNGDSYTIKRYIEYPANTFTQITWSAATSVAVSAGATVSSDTITIAIPAGAKYWERTVNLGASVTNFPLISLPTPASSTTIGVDDGNSASDQGNSGTIAASGATHFGAAAIVGTTDTATKSFLITGDSLADGASDITSAGGEGGSGYLARMLEIHGYPYTKIAVSGWTASNYVTNSATFQPFINAITYTHAINEFGNNDLAAGDSAATILGHQATINTQIGTAGVAVLQATITPKTVSTNHCVAPNDQAPTAPNFTTTLNSLNTSIRALPSGVTAAIDAADQAMTARNSDIWIVTPQMTTDCTHPYSPGAAQMATALAPTLFAASGKTLQNVQFAQGYPYLNAFKKAISFNWTAPSTPASMNRNGYPANTGSLGGDIPFAVSINPTYINAGGKLHVGWGFPDRVTGLSGGTGALQSTGGGNVTNVVTAGDCGSITVSSASGLIVSGTTTTGCDIAFNYTSTNLTSPLTWKFPATFAYTNMANAYLVQDKSGSGDFYNYFLYQVNGEETDSDYARFFAVEGPLWLRGMDAFTTNNTNVVNYTYKPLQYASFFYGSDASWFPPNLWAGTASTAVGSNLDPWIINYTDDPGSWTDGETFSFVVPSTVVTHAVTGTSSGGGGVITVAMASTSGIANGTIVTISSVGGTTEANQQWTAANVVANTSIDLTGSILVHAWTSGGSVLVTPYVQVAARAPKQLIGPNGGPYTSATLTTGTGVTSVYNSDLGQVITWHGSGNAQGTGLSYGTPYEAWTSFCIRLQKNCWYNIPTLASDAAVTALCTHAAQTLPTTLKAAVEPLNEQWNPSFNQTGLTQDIGMARGYPIVGSKTDSVGNAWYAERGAQIAALCKTAWTGAGRSASDLNIVLGIQGSPGASTESQRLLGQLSGARTAITGITNNGGNDATITAAGTWSNGDIVGIAGQNNTNVGGPSNCPAITGITPFSTAPSTNPIYTVTTGGVGSFHITQTGMSAGPGTGGCVWKVPQSPNRFVDIATSGGSIGLLSFAPYWSAGQQTGPNDTLYFISGSGNNAAKFASISCTGCLLTQAFNYVNGTPTDQANALAWLDNDFRQGVGVSYSITPPISGSPANVWTAATTPGVLFAFNAPVLVTNGGGTLPSPFVQSTAYFTTGLTGNTFKLGTPTASSPITATTGGVAPFSVGNLGNFRGLTLLNLASGTAAPTSGTGANITGWYAYWAAVANAYSLKIGSYEGGPEPWAATGAALAGSGDTYNPPSSYGGDQTISSISSVDGTITTAAAHNLSVGNAVGFSVSGCVTGCTLAGNTPATAIYAYTPHYVVNVGSSTTLKVSKTQGGSVLIPNTAGSGTRSMSQDNGNLMVLLSAYKASSAFKQLVIDQYTQQMAVSPAGSFPAQYGDSGSVANTTGTAPSPWVLSLSDENSTLYQSYYGIQYYNHH